MPGLSLSTLGTYSAALDGQPLGGFRTRLAKALLIYLACEPERHRREHLMAMLWPGLPQASAQLNLRQNLYLLRRAIPKVTAADGRGSVPFVLADHDTLQLNPDAAVVVDARRFATLIDRIRPGLSELEEAVALYRGDFLSDFYLADSNPFEEWAAARRGAYRRGVLLALERLAAIHLTDEDFAAAENYARRQLTIDPLHETGHRQLIEILARDGRRSAALAHFDDYRRLLIVELGVKPGSETLALIDAVQAGELLPAGRRPDHIRGYDIHEELGRGSYGVVFRASQPAIGRDVAIKVIPARYADDVAFIRRFEAEAQTIARLEHPRIVPLYDYWREPGSAYLVMRYLRGGNLRAVLGGAPWELERAARLLDQVAAGLAVAHRNGVVHCDVKPANILLDEDDNAYLTDFGIAKLLRPDGEATNPEEMFAGTPEYVSPEGALNEAVTPLSDQYSLGLVVYETLSGRPPFAANSLLELMEKHVREPLPSLREARSDIPGSVDQVLSRATAKRPADRYPDVGAFAQAFRAAAQGEKDLSAPGEPLLEVVNPYKGLLAFTEADEALFYGREALTRQLVARLSEGDDHHRFLAVVGPSGSGKSSLVKAGLVPALRKGALPGSEKWFVLDMIPDSHPYEEMETALLRIAVNPPSSLLGQLQDGERGLLRAIRRALPPDDGTVLLLIIDQFEELFTLVSDREVAARFLDSLYAAVSDRRSPLRVVATLRADFYDRPLLHPGFSELMRQCTEVVVPLSTDELVQAIEQPAARVGVTVAPELVAALVADVNEQPGALPLLQYTLSELFEGREDGRLTLDAYRRLGGISGALAQRAEAVYDRLDENGQTAARALFSRLVTLGEGVEDTRRRVLRAEVEALETERLGDWEIGRLGGWLSLSNLPISSPLAAAIEPYGRARLLSFDRDPVTRGPTVEIAHEALLRAWPRLRGWLDEDRAELRLGRLLTGAAAEWEAAGRDDGFLLRGSRLNQLALLAAGNIALTGNEQRYLEASLAARGERQAAEEARRQAEIATARRLAETERQRADEQGRTARRLRQRAALLAGALGLALILAVTALLFSQRATESAALAQTNANVAQTAEAQALDQGATAEAGQAAAQAAEATAAAEADFRATAEAVAIQEQETAVQQANLATSRERSLAALNTLETDPELSILLALQAFEIAHTKEAEEALHQALQASRTRLTLTGHTDTITEVAFSADGSRLATASDDGTVKVWDRQTGQLLHTLPLVEPGGLPYVELGFNDAGTSLAALVTDKDHEHLNITNWNTLSGDVVITQTLPITTDEGAFYAPAPDWTMVAVDAENGSTDLWAVDPAQKLLMFPGRLLDYGFSPDGSLLATGNRDGQVTVWDVPASLEAGSGRSIASFDSPNSAVFPLNGAFNRDQTHLAIGFANGSVEIWDLDDTSAPQLRLTGLTNVIFDLDYSPDQTMLAATGAAGVAAVWDTAGGELLYTLAGHRGSTAGIVFSPDGQALATASRDGTARVWEALPQADGELFNLATDAAVFDLELSPDEQLLAVGSFPGPAGVWNVNSGQRLLTLSGEPDTDIYRVAFHPDGSRLATAGEDNVIRVWDVVTGEVLLSWIGHGEGEAGGGLFHGTLDLTYSPNGTRLATAGTDGIAKVWDATSGAELLVLAGHTAGLHSIAYSPAGRFIATSSGQPDTTVKVWDAQTGAEIYTLSGHDGHVWGLAFSLDNSHLVTSGFSGIVKVWDMATGEELYTLPNQSTTVFDIVFTPDGQHFVTGGGVAVRVWRLEDGAEVLTLADENVRSIDVSRDGRRLYTSDISGMVRVYVLQLEDAVALAHERLTRWWRPEECLAYLHTEECPPAPEKFAANN